VYLHDLYLNMQLHSKILQKLQIACLGESISGNKPGNVGEISGSLCCLYFVFVWAPHVSICSFVKEETFWYTCLQHQEQRCGKRPVRARELTTWSHELIRMWCRS
jgi:hypothetical protein